MVLITISCCIYSLYVEGDDDELDCQLFFLKVEKSMPVVKYLGRKVRVKELFIYRGSQFFLNR